MSIFMESDGFGGTLGHAGPAFDTILRVERAGFIFFDLINLARADLGTVTTAVAFFFVNNRIHHSNSQRAWCIAYSVKI